MRRPTSLATRVVVATIGIAAIVTLALAGLVVAVSQLRADVGREARSTQTVTRVLELRNATTDVEASLRGYLLTASNAFRGPWEQSLRRLRVAEQQLRLSTRHDAPLARDVKALQSEIDAYVHDFAQPLIRIARTHPEVARSGTAATERQVRTNEIQQRFDVLLGRETARSRQRAAAVRKASNEATAAAVVAVAVVVPLIVGAGILGARAIGRRLRRAASAATEIAGGEFTTRLPEAGPAELTALAQAFNRMAAALDESRSTLLDQNARLRENERRKTELITVMSHELRTPLAGLLGFTDLLLRRDLDEATRRRYLEIAHRQSMRLSELVDRFLDVGTVEDETFELELEQVEVVELLREQVEAVLGASIGHQTVLNLPSSRLWVAADRARLTQVVDHLLANAVKYSPEGGAVEVVARQQQDVVRIEVRDHGVGIAESDRPQVFTKFFRGSAAERGIPGTGLGLAVSREIVEAHGGRIGFESEEGRGSTFWIELLRAAA